MSLQHVKQRPILYCTPMVRAIIAGQKTQTRRVVKNVPTSHDFAGFVVGSNRGKDDGKACFGIKRNKYHYDDRIFVRCPYGQIGDQLWVRETYFPATNQQGSEIFVYKADQDDQWIADFAAEDNGGWKPSIFMPRRASRILLEITDIRIERVQNISDADVLAEGIEFSGIGGGMNVHQNYCALWSRINGNQSWIENPWVWVIEFKRIEVSV